VPLSTKYLTIEDFFNSVSRRVAVLGLASSHLVVTMALLRSALRPASFWNMVKLRRLVLLIRVEAILWM